MAADSEPRIPVEVAYALPDRQWLVSLEVPDGSTAMDAIEASGLVDELDGLEVDPDRIGIFGRKCSPDQVLRPRDRVEIYRPLIADPKEVRRQRAKKDS